MPFNKTLTVANAWRFRFPLSGLLFALTVAAIAAAWWGNNYRSAQTRVTVVVLDAKTGKPITDYQYQFSASTSRGYVKNSRWIHRKSATGEFQIHVPRSCELSVEAQSPGYLQGYGEGYTTVTLRQDRKDRRVVLKLSPGVTLRGTVVDESGRPVAGALISPVIFMPPLFIGDEDRAVRSDQNGKFVLDGVDSSLGIEVTHIDYLESQADVAPKDLVLGSQSIYEIRIPLRAGETLTGEVADDLGNPLADVQVGDGAGKRVTTNSEGRFVMNSPAKWNAGRYDLNFEKSGYADYTQRDAQVGKDLAIRMERLFQVRGSVVDANGESLNTFQVIVGPGKNPAGFECEKATPTDADGVFLLSAEQTGIHWIGVRADDHAVWEGWIDVQRDAQPIRIVLNRGHSVSGSVRTTLKSADGLKARMIPMRADAHEYLVSATAAREIATLETQVAKNGRFHFPHVRPDKYKFVLEGPGITPLHQAVTIANEPWSFGVLRPKGTGRVTGVVYKPDHWGKKSVWDFADGELDHDLLEKPIAFKADENGRFEIKNVPVGKARISFAYSVSADIMSAISSNCTVVEKETTKVVVRSEPSEP